VKGLGRVPNAVPVLNAGEDFATQIAVGKMRGCVARGGGRNYISALWLETAHYLNAEPAKEHPQSRWRKGDRGTPLGTDLIIIFQAQVGDELFALQMAQGVF